MKNAIHIFLASVSIVLISSNAKINAQIKEGDKIQLWTPSNIDVNHLMNDPQYLVDAVCRKVGKHCYIMFQDGIELPSDSLIDTFANIFDTLYFPELTAAYGPAPDVFDKDSHIYILLLSDTVKWGGFFDPAQLMADTFVYNLWQRHSSEKEILYGNSYIFDFGAEWFSIFAHELIHMLTWGYDHSPEPIENPVKFWEESWLNEAWAEFGTRYFHLDMIQFGPDIINKLNNSPKVSFFNYANMEKIDFLCYLFDQYGKWNFNTALLKNQLNGIEGVENTLNNLGYAKSFDDFFEDYVIAGYINDPDFADGLYSFKSTYIESCFKSNNKCPNAGLGNYKGQLASYAKDYFYFDLSAQYPFPIEFTGDENSSFRLAFIMADSNKKVLDIKRLKLDTKNFGVFPEDSLTNGCIKLIMIVINTDRSISESFMNVNDEVVSFSYQTKTLAINSSNYISGEVTFYPNPFSQNFTVNLNTMNNKARLELYNTQGQKIWSEEILNGENINMQELMQGIFIYKLYINQEVYTGKLIKLCFQK